MISIGKTTDYALIAMARLALERRSANGQTQPISARKIADQYGLPLQQMMRVLKELARAKLLNSTRGPAGGYHLARPADRIALSEVIEAMQGRIKMAACCEEEEADACLACQLVPACPITSKVRQISDRIHNMLDEYTLADLLPDTEAAATPVGQASSKPVELMLAADLITTTRTQTPNA